MANGKLTKETLIPMGLVAGIVVAIATGAVWINVKLQSIDFNMEMLRQDLKAVHEKLDSNSSLRWSTRDMELWVQLLKAKNPAMEVPEIK